MISDDRSLAKEAFLAARELGVTQRAAYIDAICAGRDHVRRRVEARLRAESAIGSDLLCPAPVVDGAAAEPEEIDGYQVLEVLGEGGFGTVYRAKRAGPVEREVALKVLRGGVSSPEAVARFRLEQKALEAMDHPGIARVLDAGLTRAGRPYLVMELVRGEPVAALADRESLGIAERVSLAIEVCRAVQHAHQKGVIHRDLKPSNILAGREGRSAGAGGRLWVRVIDFGVAKAVAGGDAQGQRATVPLTRRLELVGTPAYMSPEQVRAAGDGDIDTRADVYAIGAVLYELFCGRPVIDQGTIAGASPAQIERLVCEDQPVSPSARAASDPDLTGVAQRRGTDGPRLVRSLRGDLDWICLRALEKERGRRYPTAEALAADLERTLAGEAVEAAPPSTLYRLSRVVRRNRGVFAGAALAAGALLIGTVVSTREMFRSAAAEQTARQQRDITDTVNTFMRENLLAAAARSPRPGSGGGRDVPMREVLEAAARKIDEFSGPGARYDGQPAVQAAIRTMLSRTFFALGDVAAATANAEAALALSRAAGGHRSTETVRALSHMGACYREAARVKEAEACFLLAVDTGRTALGDDDPATLEAIHGLANLYYWGVPRLAEAERLFREVLAARERILGPEHPETLQSAYGLGRTLLAEHRLDEAEALHRRVLEARRRILGPDNPETLWSQFNVSRVLMESDRVDEAEVLHRSVLDARLRMLGESHIATVASLHDLSELLLRTDRLAEAEDLSRRAMSAARSVFGDDHADTIAACITLGEIFTRTGRRTEGLGMMEEGVARLSRLFGPEAEETQHFKSRLESVRAADLSEQRTP